MPRNAPRIVPLDRLLLAQLVEHERDPLTSEMFSSFGFSDLAMEQASFGNAFAMIDGAHVVAGAGLGIQWHGRAKGWALITTFARRRHIVAMARYVKGFLDKRQRDPAFRRIEIEVRDEVHWCALAFARAMGFREEGWMQRWDPAGRDYFLCARVAS